ncbi:hypothetical protein VNI00_018672 [Paramarasmius palmivorus]|uniref:BTB domain-containing protein n=1 Tax=Paramarasmius palmivorus TaxID=297713 RepID=A0AAW0ATY6_9AGAR
MLMETALTDQTNILPSGDTTHGVAVGTADAEAVRAMQESTTTLAARSPLPPYSYRAGREFEFQILVNGEDCDFEIPAALLCVSSGYFSDIARSAIVDRSDFDYVQVSVSNYNRDVVFTVLVSRFSNPPEHCKVPGKPIPQ